MAKVLLTPERIAELDSKLAELYSIIIEDELDEALDDEQRIILYHCLRLAYCVGKVDGIKQMSAKAKEYYG